MRPGGVPEADGTGFCAVVLAGGTAARMGGIDKAALDLDGRTLLDRALDAFTDAAEVVVVGPRPADSTRPTTRSATAARSVTFTREDPPSGGPVAGLLTGVDALLRTPTVVGVLAVDMPHVTAATMRRLLDAATGHDGAFLVDGDGRRQLAGVLSAGRLAAARPDRDDQHGMSLRALLAGLDLVPVLPEGSEARDVDTWADWHDLQG